MIDVDAITNSPIGVKVISTVAGLIPRAAGYRLADFTAGRIAAQTNSRLVRAVRANQWVVLGVDGPQLDRAVRETLRNSAQAIFDLYHHLGDADSMSRLMVIEQPVRDLIRRGVFAERGLVLAGIHVSNFDMCMRCLSMQGIRPMVLTMPNPRGARRTEYEMRRAASMDLVPATLGGLRRALRHLEQGGALLTGIDRPIPRPRLLPRFFGRPAALPVDHVQLARRARVPVVVVANRFDADGRYHLTATEPIEMVAGPNKESEILRNAERVLSVAETLIRLSPYQWSVPLPVWPSAMELAPPQGTTMSNPEVAKELDG